MKNYICICGQNIELNDEQIRQLRESLGITSKKLRDVSEGKAVRIGEFEFVVLEHSKDTTALILKEDFKDDVQFGANNNKYVDSNVDTICCDFATKLAAIVGEENVIEHTVDLISDDGLKDYGKIRRKASLLTTALYRRYVDILDKFLLEKWWWLATPHSTKRHGNESWVKCVSPSGNIYYSYYYDEYAVRPFCILNSNIFVSEVE